MLKLAKITVSYGSIRALIDVSIEIQDGALVCLLGSNTAGKSTLLNTISGLIRSSSGEILYGEVDITNKSTVDIVRRGIVQIPEGRKIFSHLTCQENLMIAGCFPRAKKNRTQTIKEVFDMFPILFERKNQTAGTLSGGEQQMLAIARGLVAQPELLMIDEPSLGLAPLIAKNVFKIIFELNKKGTTILLVEQNVRQSLAIAGYGYIIERGRIVMEGPSQKLKEDENVKSAYMGV
jgi:branched-chain amino acid transport system ATP-binding protein